MKLPSILIRVLIVLIGIFLYSCPVQAQKQMLNPDGNTLVTPDTFVNAGTSYLETPRLASGTKVILQFNGVKVSGTASYTVYHDVSIDNGGAILTKKWITLDSLVATDGDNVKIFSTSLRYMTHRFRVVRTGTQRIAVEGWWQIE